MLKKILEPDGLGPHLVRVKDRNPFSLFVQFVVVNA